MAEKGRRQGSGAARKTNTIAPKSAEQAMLLQLDALVDAMKALAAKIDADSGDTGGDSDYAATVTDTLEKIKLR